MKKNCFYIIFFLLYFNILSGQIQKTDSLKTVLKTASLSEKINVLFELGELYREIDIDSAFYFHNQALTIAEQHSNSYNMASAFNYIAGDFEETNNYTKAVEYQRKALKILDSLDDKKSASLILLNLGMGYKALEDYDKAQECYFRAMSFFTEIKDTFYLSISIGRIGSIFYLQGDLVKSQNYYFKALILSEKINDIQSIARHHSNIGSNYLEEENYKIALYHLLKAGKLYEGTNNKGEIGVNLGNTAKAYLDLARLDEYKFAKDYKISLLEKSIDYFNRAIVILTEIKDEENILLYKDLLAQAVNVQNNLRENKSITWNKAIIFCIGILLLSYFLRRSKKSRN